MTYSDTLARLNAGELVILDGGTGTELERRGVAMDDEAWCGPAILRDPEALIAVHMDYIAAGAEIITANTYASSRLMLTPAGLAARTEEINRRSVEAALEARRRAGRPDVLVAGSLSHMVPMAAGSAWSDLSRAPDSAAMAEAFGELAQVHAAAGCNLILLEMMYEPARMALAAAAAKESGLPVWAGLSARRGAKGEVLCFLQDRDRPFEEVAKQTGPGRFDVVGVMHSSADITGPALERIAAHHDGPLMAYPDSGFFEMPHWRFEDIIAPDRLAQFAQDWVGQGARVLGGCCGLGPAHIEALAGLKG
ncbi:MAG: homocysteine S-methyltransferase family protein [Pseudomonadota bacterium]